MFPKVGNVRRGCVHFKVFMHTRWSRVSPWSPVSTGNEQHPQAFPVNRTDYYSCDKGFPHNDRHNSNRWTRKLSGDNFFPKKKYFSAFLEYMKIKTNNCVFYFGDTLTPITAYILKKNHSQFHTRVIAELIFYSFFSDIKFFVSRRRCARGDRKILQSNVFKHSSLLIKDSSVCVRQKAFCWKHARIRVGWRLTAWKKIFFDIENLNLE